MIECKESLLGNGGLHPLGCVDVRISEIKGAKRRGNILPVNITIDCPSL
jgi:hypothetical protein